MCLTVLQTQTINRYKPNVTRVPKHRAWPACAHACVSAPTGARVCLQHLNTEGRTALAFPLENHFDLPQLKTLPRDSWVICFWSGSCTHTHQYRSFDKGLTWLLFVSVTLGIAFILSFRTCTAHQIPQPGMSAMCVLLPQKVFNRPVAHIPGLYY